MGGGKAVFFLIYFFSFFFNCFLQASLFDKYLIYDEKIFIALNNYVRLYGFKEVTNEKIEKILLNHDIFDTSYVYFFGESNSRLEFEKSIFKKLKVDIKKYSHYAIINKENRFLALLIKKYLTITDIISKKDKFVIKGKLNDDIENIICYVLTNDNNLFSLLPSRLLVDKSFEFVFDNKINLKNSIFEFKILSKIEGVKVALILQNKERDFNFKNFFYDYRSYLESKSFDDLKFFLDSINNIRLKFGVSPVKTSDDLSNIAKNHNLNMLDKKNIFHSNLNFNIDKNYVFTEFLENVGRGYSREDILRSFIKSPIHLKNIISPEVEELGLAINNKENEIYVTLMLAKKEYFKDYNELVNIFINKVNQTRLKLNKRPFILDNDTRQSLDKFLTKLDEKGLIKDYILLSKDRFETFAYNLTSISKLLLLLKNPYLYEDKFTHLSIALNRDSKKLIIFLSKYKDFNNTKTY